LVLSFTKPQFGAVKFGAPAESPFPVKLTVFGEEEALLTTVRLPVALPATNGRKLSVIVKFCEGDNVTGVPVPLKEKPVPLTVICEIVTFELPVFVAVTFWVAKVFVFTLPKLTLAGVTDSVSVAATPLPLKASVAGEFGALLTNETLPAMLPVDGGVNCTLNELACPALSESGTVSPLILKPVPDTLP